MKKVARTSPNRELHVVLDNSSTHNTDAIRAWLQVHPRIHLHYTPTSASWLNQIEGFFGILAKQSLVGHRLCVHTGAPGPSGRPPPRVEREPDPVWVDEAGESHHQVTEAHA